MKKKITVPKTIKPGKGKPPEHLAYLNWEEMEYLRRLNGEGPYEGPNGIPSFVLGGFGLSGAGTYSSTGKTTTKTSTSSPKSTTTISRTSTPTKTTSTPLGGGGNNSTKTTPQRSVNAAAAAAAAISAARSPEKPQTSSPLSSERSLQRAVSQITKPSTSSPYGMRSESTIQAIADAMNRPIVVSRPGSYAGPKGATTLNPAARYATVGGVGAMPIIKVTPKDLDMAARAMLAETGGIRNPAGETSTAGLQGVAEVIRNRAASGDYPSTIAEVLTQGAGTKSPQFTPFGDPKYGKGYGTISNFGPNSPGYQAAYDIARAVFAGEQLPGIAKGDMNYGNIKEIMTGGQSSRKTQNSFSAVDGRTITDAKGSGLSHTFGTAWGSPISFDKLSNDLPGISGWKESPQTISRVEPKTVAPKTTTRVSTAGLGGISPLTPEAQIRDLEEGMRAPTTKALNPSISDKEPVGFGDFRSPKVTQTVSPAAREPVGYTPRPTIAAREPVGYGDFRSPKITQTVSPAAREPVGYGDARAPKPQNDMSAFAWRDPSGMIPNGIIPESLRVNTPTSLVNIADKEPVGYASNDELVRALIGAKDPDIAAREPKPYGDARAPKISIKDVPGIPAPGSAWEKDFDERFNKMRGVVTNPMGADVRQGVYSAPTVVPQALKPLGADARQPYLYGGKVIHDRVPMVDEGAGRVSLNPMGADARQGVYAPPPSSVPGGNVPKEAIPGGLGDLFGLEDQYGSPVEEAPPGPVFGPRAASSASAPGAYANITPETTAENYMNLYGMGDMAKKTMSEIVNPNPISPDERTVAKGYGPTPDKVIPGLWDDIQRNTLGINAMKLLAPAGVGALADIFSYVKNGKKLTDAMKDKLLTYQSATPEERAAMEQESPDLLEYGGRSPAGTGMPELDAQKALEEYKKRTSPVPEKESQSEKPKKKNKSPDGETDTNESKDGYRPYIYYLWDLGVNIPTQADSNYTEYQKYLKERQ